MPASPASGYRAFINDASRSLLAVGRMMNMAHGVAHRVRAMAIMRMRWRHRANKIASAALKQTRGVAAQRW